MKHRNWKSIGTSALSFVLAALFFLAGGFKLAGAEPLVANFERWGLPLWFLSLTGAVELAGAALLLIGRTRFYGAAVLAGAAGGGVLVHLVALDPLSAALPAFVLAALSATVAWVRRPAWIPFVGARDAATR